MLSASRNTRHPAFSNRKSDRALTSQVANDTQLSREQLRLWSYQEPPLAAGAPYTLTSWQTVQVTSDVSKTPPRLLSGPEQEVHVLGPKFALADQQTDIHSVYPAPGHSDYAETLAHVIFTHPTIPWERGIVNGSEEGSNNRMPWMGVLTFTEDELLLSTQAWTDAGFPAKNPLTKKDRAPSGQGVVLLTAGELKNNTSVASAISVDAGKINGTDYKDTDSVATVLVKKEAFRSIFSAVDAATGRATWTGAPDLSAFRLMAHVRETHGGFMATTTESSDAQPQFAAVVSARTGKPGVTSPVRAITHLVSLEGLATMALQESHTCVGLVSLYSWDWMCVPRDEVDFESVMISLGKSVSPLRINLPPAQEAEMVKAAAASNYDALRNAWLRETLEAGYSLKPHTLLTGAETRALIRGPLIPVLTTRDMIKPFAMNAASLMLHDTKSGLDDVTYASAWSLGWAMAMSDTSLTAGLLRLRGHLHAEATKRTKARAARAKKTQISAASYVDGLGTSVEALVKAHDISQLSARGAHTRWLRKQKDRQQHLLPTLCGVECDLEDEYYAEELQHVTRAYFGQAPSDGSDIPQRAADSDAVLIRAWALDKFYLASIPLQYLVPDPDMLPRESIRTFCIDPRWIGSLIDGGLSLANHFAQDDDAIRREIKNCINTYLSEVRGAGPGKGTTLQIPKWGFFLRSVAVTAFPDLKVEARLRDDTPEGVREVLYMQVLQDDILVCLFDRMPGQDNFESIRISQPAHQQCFALGRDLTKDRFHISLRPIPVSSRDAIDAIDTPCTADAEGKIDFYDWGSRMVRPGALAKRYLNVMGTLTPEQLKNREIVRWAGSKDDVPSSIIASQLSRPVLQLTLAVTKEPPTNNAGDNDPSPSWTKRGAMLHVAPRPLKTAKKAANDGGVATTGGRPDAKFTALPVGPMISANQQPASTSNAAQHPELTAHGIREDALERPAYSASLPYFPRPRDAACFPLYDPASTSGVISALRQPLDLVFSLRCMAAETEMQGVYPDRLEVRIPVALSSGVYPPNTQGGANALLTIPGTAAAPMLPVVEGLNGSGLWSYRTRLVVGSLYGPPGKPPRLLAAAALNPVPSTLLVVEARPRFGRDRMRDAFFDGSFLLRRVSVVRPSPSGSYGTAEVRDAQFDVVWHPPDAGGPVTVFPRAVRVREAVTVRFLEPGSYYDLDAEKMMVQFETSAPLPAGGPYEIAVVYEPHGGGGERVELLVVVPGPFPDKEGVGRGQGYVAIKRDMLPRWVRLVVRAKDGRGVVDRCGPESSALVIPRVSGMLAPYQVNMFYDGEKAQVTWPADTVTHGRDYDFEVTFDWKTERAVTVRGSDGAAHLARATLDACRIPDGRRVDIPVRETSSTHPRLRGTTAQGSVNVDLPWLLCKTDLDFSGTPSVAPLSDVARMPVLRVTLNDCSTELFYWAADKNLCIVRTRRALEEVTVKLADSGIPDDCSPRETNGRLDVYDPNCNDNERRRELDWVGIDGSLNGMERARQADEAWTRVGLRTDKGTPILGRPGVLATGPALDGGTRVGSSVVSWGGFWNTRKWWVGPKGEVRQSVTYRSTGRVWVGDELLLPEGTVSLGGDKFQWWEGNVSYMAGHNFMWRKAVGGGLAWGGMGQDDREFSFTKDAVPGADLGPDSNFYVTRFYRTLPPSVETLRGEVTLVVWVKRDGSVNVARSYSQHRADRKWECFLVAPAGSAHPATRLLVVTSFLSACLLFWFDPMGHLVSAKCTQNGDDAASLEHWDHARVTLPRGEQPVTDPNGRMNILVTEDSSAGVNMYRRDIVWVDPTGRLRSFGFENA